MKMIYSTPKMKITNYFQVQNNIFVPKGLKMNQQSFSAFRHNIVLVSHNQHFYWGGMGWDGTEWDRLDQTRVVHYPGNRVTCGFIQLCLICMQCLCVYVHTHVCAHVCMFIH